MFFHFMYLFRFSTVYFFMKKKLPSDMVTLPRRPLLYFWTSLGLYSSSIEDSEKILRFISNSSITGMTLRSLSNLPIILLPRKAVQMIYRRSICHNTLLNKFQVHNFINRNSLSLFAIRFCLHVHMLYSLR